MSESDAARSGGSLFGIAIIRAATPTTFGFLDPVFNPLEEIPVRTFNNLALSEATEYAV